MRIWSFLLSGLVKKWRVHKRRMPYFVMIVLLTILVTVLHFEGFLLKSSKLPNVVRSLDSETDRCHAIFESISDVTNFDNNNRNYIIKRMQLIRLFSHCYIRNGAVPKRKRDFHEMEKNLFPMLDFSPTQVHHDAKGRGIVMSLSANGFSDLRNLIVVLDLLENTLPIEVFHRSDVSPQLIAQIGLGNQNVSFKDVEKLIPAEHKHRYARFANKWPALLLNSFEEMLFMDTDVVPFMNPETFFLTKQYLASNSHFFRDRASDETIRSRDLMLYRMLLPTQQESDTFGIDMQNPLRITKLRHQMESGVVAMSRKKYMPGLLVGAAMQFWNRTSEPVWGDKELFWLGQMISGEGGFEFAKYNAGAIGKVQQEKNILTDEVVANYTCSIQPAHFDDNLNLMWINGGMRHCKWASWDRDWQRFKNLRKQYGSKEKMTSTFLGPIKPDGVVIPPLVMHSRWYDRLISAKYGWFRNDSLGCSGYQWCAYDTQEYPGRTVMFNEQQKDQFSRLEQAWWTYLRN